MRAGARGGVSVATRGGGGGATFGSVGEPEVHSGRSEAAGYGNGWHTRQICRTVVAQQQSTSRILVRPDANVFLIQERRLNGGRGKDEGIHIRFRERQMQLLEELFLNLH